MRIIMSPSPHIDSRLFHQQPICFIKIFVGVVIIVAGVGVGLSDGASVQIPVRVSDAGRIVISEEESIESLASSKILMDRTSSLSGSLSLSLPHPPPQPSMLKVTGISQSSKLIKSGKSITAVVATKLESPAKTGSEQRGDDDSDVKKEDVVSPLHVAQCRATCLEKFALHDRVTSAVASISVANVSLKNQPSSNKMNEDIRLLPNILRLKRKKRATSSPTSPSGSSGLSASCFQNSPECLSCWKNCQLLEVRNSSRPSETIGKNPEAEFPTSKRSQLNKVGREEETTTTSQHPILACSSFSINSAKSCTAGCQVACSFYERLLTKAGEQRDGMGFMGADPVVATKHESVVKIVPGKITWPDAVAVSSSALSSGPVVYVVIQEYPDRKWRQIAQTTDQELSIPTELTGAMKTKLRSVRVLVVGPEGLRSIYSPLDSSATTVKQQQKQRQQRQFSFSAKKNDKFGEMGEAKETSTASTAEAITTETNDYDINNNSNVEMMGARESDASTNEAPELKKERESGTLPTAETSSSSTTTTASPSGGGIGITSVVKPFEIRLVSLIHQKSLVIAELRWDDVGGNPSQEYLITWELTGGGLKGHLVTDSTSVTLSLWPDTTYQIQVEEFVQNLDSDGEQPTPENSDSAVKSYPLIVDTSIASFPMERPSALLSDKTDEKDGEEDEDSDNYQQDEQDEFSEEDEEGEEIEEDEPLGHKSIGKVLLVSFISLVLVLGILTLVAFTWIKLRMLSCEKASCAKVECGSENGGGGGCEGASDCLSFCFGCGCDADPEKDPNLLVSQEDLYLATQDECANCSSSLTSSSFYPSPLHYAASLKKSKRKGCFKQSSQHSNKMTGQQDLPVAVAVISSASTSLSSSSSSCTGAAGEISGPAPYSVFNCYNNVYSNSSSLASSSPSVAPAVAETKSSKQGCPSFFQVAT